MPTKSPSPDLRPRAFCTHQPSPAAPHALTAQRRPRAAPALPPRGVERVRERGASPSACTAQGWSCEGASVR